MRSTIIGTKQQHEQTGDNVLPENKIEWMKRQKQRRT